MKQESPEQTARSLTLKGIESLIRNAERELAELDEFDAKFGELGREARARGRQRSMHNLEHAREAHRIRSKAGGS